MMKYSIYKLLLTSFCYKPLNTACHTLVYPLPPLNNALNELNEKFYIYVSKFAKKPFKMNKTTKVTKTKKENGSAA